MNDETCRQPGISPDPVPYVPICGYQGALNVGSALFAISILGPNSCWLLGCDLDHASQSIESIYPSPRVQERLNAPL